MSNQSPEPFAPSAPAGIPEAPLPAPTAPAGLSRVKPIIAVAAYLMYAIVCVVALFVLNHRVSLAQQLVQGQTVSVDDAQAADDNVSSIVMVLLLAFVVMLVAAVLWERNLAKSLGRPLVRTLQRRYGLRIVWIAWVVLWGVGTATQNSTPSDPQSLISSDHRSMFLLGARAVLLVVIAALTLMLYRRARTEAANAPAQMAFAAPLGY